MERCYAVTSTPDGACVAVVLADYEGGDDFCDPDGLPQFQEDFDATARQFLDEVAAPKLCVLARCVTKTLPSSQFLPL